jgi:hypothetical protein
MAVLFVLEAVRGLGPPTLALDGRENRDTRQRLQMRGVHPNPQTLKSKKCSLAGFRLLIGNSPIGRLRYIQFLF